MRQSLGLAVIALVGALTACATTSQRDQMVPWYTFTATVQEPLGHPVEIAVRPAKSPSNWLARRRVAGTTDWIDGRRCPALAETMASLKNLEPMRVMLPDDPVGQMLDGVDYKLEVRSYFPSGGPDGRMTLRGNLGTPLAKWVQDTTATLDSCWQQAYPR